MFRIPSAARTVPLTALLLSMLAACGGGGTQPLTEAPQAAGQEHVLGSPEASSAPDESAAQADAQAPLASPTAVQPPSNNGVSAPLAQAATLRVTSFAACNGGDDTAGIKAALAALRANDVLVIPAGVTCRHSTVLNITTAGVRITGPGTLLATHEAQSAVWMNADNITLDGGLLLKTETTTKRWNTPNQTKLVLYKGRSGGVVRDVTSEGSAGAGIYVYGATNFTLDRVTVLNSRADGIHMSAGAHHGTITNPIVRGAGDDGISVVSYQSTAEPCHDIVVSSPKVYDNTFARGMSIIGGYNVTYSHVYVEGSPSAAVFISSNTTWNTHATHDVKILSATLVNSNTDPRVPHGAVVVASNTAGGITGAVLKDITIKTTRVGAPANVQILSYSGSPITGVSMDRFKITGGPARAFNATTVDGYELTNWVVNGAPIPNQP